MPSCPKCRFDLATSEKMFPFKAPPLGLVIDPSHLLPEGLEAELEKGREKFRKRFPQIEISFCFVRMQPGVAIQEFAFWLHNSAPEAGESRAWQLLVVGDLTSARLALTVGYGLEPFVKGDLWEAALQELAACIADQEWKEGLNGFLADARDLLTAAWGVAERRRLKNRDRQYDDNRAPTDSPATDQRPAEPESEIRQEEPVAPSVPPPVDRDPNLANSTEPQTAQA